MPKSRIDFWRAKLIGNVERDHRKRVELESMGWKVMVIWECETKDADKLSELTREIKHQNFPPTK